MNQSIRPLFIFRHLSDYLITSFFLFVGLILLIYLFYLSPSTRDFILSFTDPVISLISYLWIKAFISDYTRIRRGETIKMPGFVYWVHALQFGMIWAIYRTMYEPRIFEPSTVEHYLYFENPLLFWIGLDAMTAALFFWINERVKRIKTTANLLIVDLLRALVTFHIFIILHVVLAFL